jgi:hypothetical protein
VARAVSGPFTCCKSTDISIPGRAPRPRPWRRRRRRKKKEPARSPWSKAASTATASSPSWRRTR